MPHSLSAQPKTLAEDLRSRSDDQLAELLRARPDLLHPVPSDMRALTTRAATSPSIARYLDTVDCVHHYALRVASEQVAAAPTTSDRIVNAVVDQVGEEGIRDYVHTAVEQLWSAAVLWGSTDQIHVVTAVRDQVAAAPVPVWPSATCHGTAIDAAHLAAMDLRGGARAHELIATIEEIGDAWRYEPGPVLRSGGLSARALDALADTLGSPKHFVATALDTAWGAGLFAQGPTASDIGWMPTAEFDNWCQQPAAKRWATVVQAWRIRPGVTGARPLTDDEVAFATVWREHLLITLADATHACDLATAIDVIDFRWPRRRGAKRNEILAASWHEAEHLGVLVDGTLTSTGRELARANTVAKLASSIGGTLTNEIDHVHIQADHTIVAPGPLPPALGRQLRMMADVESRGHATVFRLTNISLKRALAIDPDPEVWRRFLTDIGSKGLPQPVAYLITDAARSTPPRATAHQAPAAPRPARRARVDATSTRVDKALDVLRAREQRNVLEMITDAPDDVPAMESAAVVAALRYSIDHHETVRITHAESDGSVAALLVDPIRLGGGSLTAYDHHAEQVKTFAVSRISGVATVRISA